MVDARRLRGGRVVANRDQRATDTAAQKVPGSGERQDEYQQRKQEHPLVEAQRQAERHFRTVERHALRAAGPTLDRFVLGEDRNHHAQGEGRHGEVHAAEAQRGPAEGEAREQAHERRKRDRGPQRNRKVRDQDRRGIGADGVKRAMAQGNLAVVADQDVQAEQGDGVDQDIGELEELEIAREQRRARGGGHEEAEAGTPHVP